MKRFFSILFILISTTAQSQLPDPAFIGYWQNWNDGNSPYIQLDQIDSRYNVIEVSFATPQSGTDYKMQFTPDQTSQSTLIAQIQALKGLGKKVLISIGGATDPVSLSNTAERDTFVSTMNAILTTYDFDGVDIDLEGSSLSTSGGNISNPIDQPIINLIDAIRQMMSDYRTTHNKKMLLTMAPETAFVQGGQSSYGGIWGAYLPVIDALRDSLDVLQVQLYNSGSMYGIDGNVYSQGSSDFIIAMTEALIQGFNTSGGFFAGLPANKIAIGLPACSNAAGGGYTLSANVQAAVNYLRGTGPKPGSYTLFQNGGYPSLRGLMTWSINWDAVNTCGSTYEFATNFETIFGIQTNVESFENNVIAIFPNPVSGKFEFVAKSIDENNLIRIFNSNGQLVYSDHLFSNHTLINMENYSCGIYLVTYGNTKKIIVKQ